MILPLLLYTSEVSENRIFMGHQLQSLFRILSILHARKRFQQLLKTGGQRHQDCVSSIFYKRNQAILHFKKILKRGSARFYFFFSLHHYKSQQYIAIISSPFLTLVPHFQFNVKLCRRLDKIFPFRQQKKRQSRSEQISFSQMLSFFYG